MTARRRTTRRRKRRRRRWPRTGPSPTATPSSTTTTAKPTERPGPESCRLPPPARPLRPLHTGTPERPPGPDPSGAGPQLCLTLTAGALPPLTCCLNPLRFPGTGGDPTGMVPIPPGWLLPSRPEAPRIGSGQRARPQPLAGLCVIPPFPTIPSPGGGENPLFPALCPAGKAGSIPAPPNREGGREEQGIPGCFSA